jgi:hypothetical protein
LKWLHRLYRLYRLYRLHRLCLYFWLNRYRLVLNSAAFL